MQQWRYTKKKAAQIKDAKERKQWKCQNANANIFHSLWGGAVQIVGGV